MGREAEREIACERGDDIDKDLRKARGGEEKRPRRYTELERQSSNYRGDAVKIRKGEEEKIWKCLRTEEEKFKIKAEAVAACLVV